jgi:Tol biopolymer transport system component
MRRRRFAGPLVFLASAVVACASDPDAGPRFTSADTEATTSTTTPVASVVPDTTTPTPVAPVVPDTTAPTPVTNGWVALDSAQTGGGDIYLVRPGEDARRLEVAESDTTAEVCPTWSPDGTRLLFGRLTGSEDTTFSDAELVIVPVGLDGTAGAPTVIALDGFDDLDGFDACAIWAPDGRWVAFGAGGEVWVVDTQTGAIRRLPDLRPIDLEWRPGTDQLAIAGDMGTTGDWGSTPVIVYSVSTGELHQLGSVEAAYVTWSPDGATIAFARLSRVESGDDEHDSTSLWLVDADGANERLLVADPFNANHGIGPMWSPTGDRIAYQRVIGCCEQHEVVLVNVADGTETVIEPPQTDGPNGPVRWYPWTVTWSPDGTTLLYTAWSDAPGRTEQQGVIAVPADTPSNVTVLTDSDTDTFYPEHHQWVLIQNWGRLPVDSSPATLPATTTPTPGTGGGPAFAAAIEASGVLTSPSADDVAKATDSDLYKDDFEVSAAGNYVSLRCTMRAVGTPSPCGTGWAYVTWAAGGGEVHGGLLGGDASDLDLHLLDDRYFVASESSPDAQAPSRAWLIDAASGKAGALSWRDEPTTLNSPEQALLLCQEEYPSACATARGPAVEERFVDQVESGGTVATVTYVQEMHPDVPTEGGLPKVVDARHGTIRPLAMPDDVVAALPVTQHGTGRIWVGTDPDGDGLGLAYSDDGGATWADVALPEQLRATSEELATGTSDKLLEIAADGDRVAVALSWERETERDNLYVSDDAGQSWTTAPSEPAGNGAHLYVLADGRLVLMWSMDPYPVQLLMSTGSQWAELEKVDVHFQDPTSLSGSKRFSVNRAGIALIPSFIYPCEGSSPCPGYSDDEGEVLDTIDFSTDLTNWSTIESLDD